MSVKGWPVDMGSKARPNRTAEVDSPIAERLRAAGAVLLGNTRMPDHGWKATTNGPFGPSKNPWNFAHTPGGSSGGSAAALAAGIAPLAVGSDGGGSIRIPAALTGTVGFKPTCGLVPAQTTGVMGTLSHFGPMARSVNDVYLLLQVLAGYDNRDRTTLTRPGFLECSQLHPIPDLASLRVGVWDTPLRGQVSPALEAAMADVTALLRAGGAAIQGVSPSLCDGEEAWLTMWKVGLAQVVAGCSMTEVDLLDPGLVELAREGQSISGVAYLQAIQRRGELTADFAAHYDKLDLIVSPVNTITHLSHDVDNPPDCSRWIDWSPFSWIDNLIGTPALAIPVSVQDSIPASIQIHGPLRRYCPVRWNCPGRLDEQHPQPRVLFRSDRPSRLPDRSEGARDVKTSLGARGHLRAEHQPASASGRHSAVGRRRRSLADVTPTGPLVASRPLFHHLSSPL